MISSIKLIAQRVTSDVSRNDAIKILNKIFADNGIDAKAAKKQEAEEGNFTSILFDLNTSYAGRENFVLTLDNKQQVSIDNLGSMAFSPSPSDMFMRNSPDFVKLNKATSAKAFDKWAKGMEKIVVEATADLIAMKEFAVGFSKSVADIQKLIASNKS